MPRPRSPPEDEKDDGYRISKSTRWEQEASLPREGDGRRVGPEGHIRLQVAPVGPKNQRNQHGHSPPLPPPDLLHSPFRTSSQPPNLPHLHDGHTATAQVGEVQGCRPGQGCRDPCGTVMENSVPAPEEGKMVWVRGHPREMTTDSKPSGGTLPGRIMVEVKKHHQLFGISDGRPKSGSCHPLHDSKECSYFICPIEVCRSNPWGWWVISLAHLEAWRLRQFNLAEGGH